MRSVPALLAFTDGDVWRPAIGDPSLVGWLTVGAYFAVAILCLSRGRGAFQAQRRSVAWFWAGLGVLLVFLGINKQLDLQTLLTLTGRRIAVAQGWYEYRRVLQLAFVGGVACAAVAGALGMKHLAHAHGVELRIALIGFVLLLTFVVVRAASFHHMDAFIQLDLAGVRMNWILELGAIGIIGFGACSRAGDRKVHQPGLASSGRAIHS